MEPLAHLLEISVSELLGLENEPAEQIIKNITEISVSEKEKSEKDFRHNVCAISVSAAAFIAEVWLWYIASSDNGFMLRLFEFSGTAVFNVLAVLIGLAAWCLGLVSAFSYRKRDRWKIYSIISGLLCSVSLYIPSLTVDLIARFEYLPTIEDTSWAYNYGGAVLLMGTVLLNVCSALVHRRRGEV